MIETASHPFLCNELTISLLNSIKTFSTIDITSLFVTRNPLINSVLICVQLKLLCYIIKRNFNHHYYYIVAPAMLMLDLYNPGLIVRRLEGTNRHEEEAAAVEK